MNIILNWLTKKKLFVISLVSSVIFFVFLPKEMLLSICETHGSPCFHSMSYLLMILMLGVTSLVPTLIMLFTQQHIFDSWKKTLFIYLFIMIVTPWKGGDVYFRIEKDLFTFYTSVIYLVFSIIWIISKSLKKE